MLVWGMCEREREVESVCVCVCLPASDEQSVLYLGHQLKVEAML